MFKERPHIKISQITDVAIIAFLVSFTVSITSPIFPIFAEKIAGTPEMVGLIASVFGLSAIFINLNITRVFEKYGAIRCLKTGALIFSAVFASYFLIDSPAVLTLMQIGYAAAVCFTWTALSILVNNSSTRRNLGDSEGEYFTFVNLGVLFGLLVGGAIATAFSYSSVFFFASAMFIGIYFISGSIGINYDKNGHKSIKSIRAEAKRFFSNADLRKTYLLNVGLYFWVSIAFLYLPIIMRSLGLGFKSIGMVFAAIIVPYVLLEYPIGQLAQKEGSRKYLSLGFLAIAAASILIYANFGAIYSMALFFFLASMGAAMIEPLNEMDLNARSRNGKIVENMTIFKTSLRVAYFIGPLTAAALIEFFGMREMFLVLGIIMAGFWWMVGE